MNPVIAAGVLGATGVIAGAFGAHALRDHLEPDRLASFETGVRYQLLHALALLAVGALAQRSSEDYRLVTLAFVAGTVLFSGSIYVLSLGGPRWFGPITPIGGMLLIGGWAALIFVVRETSIGT